MTIFATVYHFTFRLPTITDSGVLVSINFSVKNARHYLESITSYGVRQVGSKANEIDMPIYFKKALDQIMENSKEMSYEIQETRSSGEEFNSSIDGESLKIDKNSGICLRLP